MMARKILDSVVAVVVEELASLRLTCLQLICHPAHPLQFLLQAAGAVLMAGPAELDEFMLIGVKNVF
jgi:hypothetical protein